jgi:hypothetical protein
MAVAHQILTVIYHMLRDNQPYRDPGPDFYDQQRRPEITRRLVERLQRLGYQVTLEEPLNPPESESPQPTPEDMPPKRKRGRPCKCLQRGLDCSHVPLMEPLPSSECQQIIATNNA